MSDDRSRDGSIDSPAGSDGAGPRRAEGGLTDRQRTILDVIRASVTSRGYPPSIREIGDAVGLTSDLIGRPSVAHPRTQGLSAARPQPAARRRRTRLPTITAAAVVSTDVAGSDALPEPTFVPVLGRIAAGGSHPG